MTSQCRQWRTHITSPWTHKLGLFLLMNRKTRILNLSCRREHISKFFTKTRSHSLSPLEDASKWPTLSVTPYLLLVTHALLSIIIGRLNIYMYVYDWCTRMISSWRRGCFHSIRCFQTSGVHFVYPSTEHSKATDQKLNTSNTWNVHFSTFKFSKWKTQ